MKIIPRDLIRDKIYCVNYLVYLNGKGDREFVYIAVRQDRMEEFKKAISHGNFDADDYGLVLEHGRGDASDILKEKMKMMYKCDHSSSINVLDYQA